MEWPSFGLAHANDQPEATSDDYGVSDADNLSRGWKGNPVIEPNETAVRGLSLSERVRSWYLTTLIYDWTARRQRGRRRQGHDATIRSNSQDIEQEPGGH